MFPPHPRIFQRRPQLFRGRPRFSRRSPRFVPAHPRLARRSPRLIPARPRRTTPTPPRSRPRRRRGPTAPYLPRRRPARRPMEQAGEHHRRRVTTRYPRSSHGLMGRARPRAKQSGREYETVPRLSPEQLGELGERLAKGERCCRNRGIGECADERFLRDEDRCLRFAARAS